MNQINDLPGYSDFGMDFNYEAWESAYSELTLCNVTWDASYKDAVWYDSYADLNTYLESKPHNKKVDFEYLKPGEPVVIDLPLNRASMYNYVHVKNTSPTIIGDTPRDLYYFVVGVNWKAPHATELVLQLDAWQTWIRHMQIGRCFLKQGHAGMLPQMHNTISAIRRNLTMPEGLDTGSEYQVAHTVRHALTSSSHSNGGDFGVAEPKIWVISNVEMEADTGTVEKPKFTAASGGTLENLPTASNIYIFANSTVFNMAMDALKDKPWMTSGIVSITAVPLIEDVTTEGVQVGGMQAGKVKNSGFIKHSIVDMTQLYDEYANIGKNFGARYKDLHKFKTHPYSVIEMTTNEGQPLILKPELWGGEWKIVIMYHVLPPNQKIAILPFRYNSAGTQQEWENLAGDLISDNAEWLDMATFISSFPQFTILNNGAIAYMANNAGSLAYQQQSMDWSQSKALTSAELGYDQTSNSMTNMQNQTNLQNATAGRQTALQNDVAGQRLVLNAVQGIAGGMAGGASGGLPGMGVGLIGGVANAAAAGANHNISVDSANQSLAINNSASQAGTGYALDNARFNRDTNLDYANFAAKGDYQNAMAGYNAKLRDTQMIQPSTVGQMGGNAFNMAKYMMGVDIKLKTIPPGSAKAIGEYWMMYGYAMNDWFIMPAKFRVMSKFTYWKLSETFIRTSSAPEHMKQTIRGILESGIRVWSNADDIGMIDPVSNTVISGVTI